jgi:hypothetical protein
MGPNRRAQERERAAAGAAEEAKRAEAERKAIADAQNALRAGGLPHARTRRSVRDQSDNRWQSGEEGFDPPALKLAGERVLLPARDQHGLASKHRHVSLLRPVVVRVAELPFNDSRLAPDEAKYCGQQMAHNLMNYPASVGAHSRMLKACPKMLVALWRHSGHW